MDKQSLTHHIVVSVCYYAAFWQQDYCVTCGAASCFFEISTPFIVTRSLIAHHSELLKGTIFEHINSFFLTTTFLLGRLSV